MRKIHGRALDTPFDLAAVLIAMVIVPLATGTEMHVILPRAAMAVALLAMFIFNLRFTVPGLPLRIFSWLGLVWLLYGSLSLLWAPSIAAGAKQLVAICLGTLSAGVIAVLLCSSEGAATWARRAWIAAFLITLPIAVKEIRTDQHRASSMVEHVESGGMESVTGKFAAVTFGNRNNYVSFLCMVLPAILIEMSITLHSHLRIVYYALAAAVFALVVLDASRLGMVLSLGQLLIVLWLLGKRKGLAFKAFVVSLIAVGYIAVAVSQFTQTRIESAFSDDDQSFSQRFDYSLRGLRLVANSGGMGVGAGGYGEVAENGILVSAHDVWIEIAADYGFLIASGFIGLLLLSFVCLRRTVFRGRRSWKDFHSDALYGFLLAASLPGIGFINSSCIASAQFWAVVGIVVGIASARPSEVLSESSMGWPAPVGEML